MTTAVQFGDVHLTVLHRDDMDLGPVRRGYAVPHSQFRRLVIHHTVTLIKDWDGDGIVMGDLDDIARHQRMLQTIREADLGPEVPYSWNIAEHPDPNRAIIAEGRGWGRTGAHTAGYNSSAYGVSIIGNTNNRPITPGMIAAVRFLGAWLDDPATVLPTIGHRDTKATACPGESAYAALPEMQPQFSFDNVTEEVEPMPDEVSDWAAEAWTWMVAEGITKGGNPSGTVSREAFATMLHRYHETVAVEAGHEHPEPLATLKFVADNFKAIGAQVDKNTARLDKGALGLKG